jgi:hypothetical protein
VFIKYFLLIKKKNVSLSLGKMDIGFLVLCKTIYYPPLITNFVRIKVKIKKKIIIFLFKEALY